MPREDDDPMDTDAAFDQLIHRIGSRDDTPRPVAGFVRSLESRLAATDQRRSPAGRPSRSSALPWVGPRASTPLAPSHRAARMVNLGAVCLVLIALAAGGIGYRRMGGGGSTPEAATVAAVSLATPSVRAEGSPDAATSIPAAGQTMACSTAPRPPGTFEAILAAGTSGGRRTFPPIPVGGVSSPPVSVLDGDYYIGRSPEIHDERVLEIDAALAELWACRFLVASGPMQLYDGNRPYWALHTDGALRRASLDVPDDYSPFNAFEPLLMRQYPSPVSAFRLFEFERFEAPRLAAVLPGPPTCRDQRGPSKPPAYLVVFAEIEGRWLLDEFAIATFAEMPPAAGDLAVEPLDLLLGDLAGRTFEEDEAGWSAYSICNASVWADEPVDLRFHNTGTAAIRIVAESLGLDVTVAPGGVEVANVTATAGTVRFSLFQDGADDGVASGTIEFASPGTVRPPG